MTIVIIIVIKVVKMIISLSLRIIKKRNDKDEDSRKLKRVKYEKRRKER